MRLKIFKQSLKQLYKIIVRKKFDATYMPSLLGGIDFLREPNLYKGLAFTHKERQELHIHGLLPPRVLNQEEQELWIHEQLLSLPDNLAKYVYMMSILDRNQKLFYSFVNKYIEETLPIVYTPTVGLACERYGLIYRRPRGLFITIHDLGHVASIFQNWYESDVKIIVVTDGERILGLGDLGSYGMGIPIGKLNLYTALGGIRPGQCLPVMLDVGTNNKQLLDAPYYIGLKMNRVRQELYDQLLDEFMDAAVNRFGKHLIIQFEDFAIQNAYRLLNKYKDKYCTFNDDIQGTASVVVAGLLTAMRKANRALKDNVILFQGAGSAAQGIASLILMALEQLESVPTKEACDKIWMNDIDGLVTQKRGDCLSDVQKLFAKNIEPMKGLDKIVKYCKATIIIGVSAVKGSFTTEVLTAMTEHTDTPVIFALSNPTNKAECTPAEAITATKGKCIFASGSPFPPTEYEGRTYHTRQGNNAYIFPGIGLGVLCAGLTIIPDEIFLIAAQTLANQVTPDILDKGSVYPPVNQIPICSIEIAKQIMHCAYKCGSATNHPEPDNYDEYIKRIQYNLKYRDYTTQLYDYPKDPK